METRKECPVSKQPGPEKIVREIKRQTRRRFSSEEKTRPQVGVTDNGFLAVRLLWRPSTHVLARHV
jgi:hypothetical protein